MGSEPISSYKVKPLAAKVEGSWIADHYGETSDYMLYRSTPKNHTQRVDALDDLGWVEHFFPATTPQVGWSGDALNVQLLTNRIDRLEVKVSRELKNIQTLIYNQNRAESVSLKKSSQSPHNADFLAPAVDREAVNNPLLNTLERVADHDAGSLKDTVTATLVLGALDSEDLLIRGAAARAVPALDIPDAKDVLSAKLANETNSHIQSILRGSLFEVS